MVMDDLPWNHWYPLFLSREISRNPQKAERFGLQWVTYRNRSHRPIVSQDRCPHLGASLSQGWLDGEMLRCPFHGFGFDENGHCQEVPALGPTGRIPQGLCLRSLELREVGGWIWGWWGEAREHYPDLPVFEALQSPWRGRDIAKDWTVHLSRAIENQLDVAHLPFVHAKTIGAGGRTEVEGPITESDHLGIKVWVTNRKADDSPQRSLEELKKATQGQPCALELKFPALWQLRIHDRLRLVIGFVPINGHRTRFYIRSAHQVKWPFIRTLYEWILVLSNRWILGEDERIVTKMVPSSSLEALNDQLIAADRAIVWFRKTWRRAQRSAQDLETPKE